MKIPSFILLVFLLLFSACGGGGSGGGANSTPGDNNVTDPLPTPVFSCELNSTSELVDKGLTCTDDIGVAYTANNNSLCRVSNLEGVAVSTCMEAGLTLSAQTCMRGGADVNCPDIDFSCEVSSLSTSDNWILSCDDNITVSMDISNDEMCRVDLVNSMGFCLDDENTLNQLPTVWRGYARDLVGVGEDVPLNIPLWGPSGTVFRYRATPAEVCSVESETGELSIDGFGECQIALTVSANGASKVIEKTVHGRLAQNTVWNGYRANVMSFGETPPALIGAPQYAPYGADLHYSSENTDVCTVDSDTGEIAPPLNAGDCIIIMTSTKANYIDRRISFTIRVDPLSLPALTWADPYGTGPFDVSTTVSAPNSGALTGQGSLSVSLENYRSTTPTICTVDETTGVPTLLLNGDCIVEADASIPGYTPQTFSTTLTVALATMSLTWTSPIPSLGNTDSVQPDEPLGIPGSAAIASLVYSSETPLTCSVDSATGEITPIINGTCTAVLTVIFPGYEPGIVKITIEIDEPQSTQWTGYSSDSTPIDSTPFSKETLTLDTPTGEPSGATLAYSSLTTDICTVDSDRVLTLVDAGDCRVRLISSHEDYGDKLIDFQLTITPLDLPALGWGNFYGPAPFNVESTGLAPDLSELTQVPSGVDLILRGVESASLDICTTDDNGNLTLLSNGSCSLTATVGAKGYNDGSVMGTVEVGLADMTLTWDGYDDDDDTITFGDAAPVLEPPSFTTATVTPHTFSYTSGDIRICTVDEEGALTILRDGSCEITLMASALGYNNATVTSIQTIELGTITGVTWSGYSPDSVEVGGSREVTAPSGVPEGASISYTVNDETICSVDAMGTVGGLEAGTCEVTLTVTRPSYSDFTETNNVTVGDAQSIGWTGYSPSTIVFGETPTLNPPTDTDDVTVAYSSSTEDICTVDDTSGELTIVNHGSCTVLLTATKADHGTKVISFDLTINPAMMNGFAWDGYDEDTVVFTNVPDLEEPTGAASGATLTYASQTEEICTVDSTSGELTFVDAGVCTVNVTAAAMGYMDASLSTRVTITVAPMSFTWGGYSSGSVAFGATPPTLNVPSGVPQGASFRYSATPLSVCLIDPSDGSLTLAGVGPCTITVTASAPGYTDGDKIFEMLVNSGRMSSLTWSGYSASNIDFGDTTPTLEQPTGVPKGTTLAYASSTPQICSVDSATGALDILNWGDCTITLSASAAKYRMATVDFLLTIDPLNMSSFGWAGYSSIVADFGNPPPTLVPPTGTPDNTSFRYTTSDKSVCTVNSLTGELAIVGIGDCHIRLLASAVGYNSSSVTRLVSFSRGTIQGVVWEGYDNGMATFPNGPNFIEPTGIPSDATKNYTSSDEDICMVDSATGALTLIDEGTCTIRLTISRSNYENLTMTFDLTIQPLEMTDLAWTGYPSPLFIKESFIYPNPFTGAPNGTRYRYSTSTPNICSVENGGDLWGRDLGTCRVSVTAQAPGYRDKSLPEMEIVVVGGGIATGASWSCALLVGGQVKCWGNGSSGGLGQGNANNLGDNEEEMGYHLISVNLGKGLRPKFIAISNGSSLNGHACAIFDNGKVKCWGANGRGQLGQGSSGSNVGDNSGEMGNNLAYVDIANERTAKILSLGEEFSCVLLDNGRIICWGRNDQGQLGLGHTIDRSDLAFLEDGVNYSWRQGKDISAGYDHVCALLENNGVKCWGGNAHGQLGQGHTDNIGDDNLHEVGNLIDVDLGDSRTAKRVAAGRHYSCAILDNNDLACWGDRSNNKLGIDTDANNPNIGDESGEMGDSLTATHLVSQDAIGINLGGESTCVVKKGGTLSCWGGNDYGQLGLGHSDQKGSTTTTSADIEVNVGSDRNTKMVQAGYEHTCALLDDNSIKCWGRNNAGQLGQEDTTTRGDDAGEMGDDLAAISLIPNMIFLNWRGYDSNTVDYGDIGPALIDPTGAPLGTTFSYSTTETSVCLVDRSSGFLTIVGGGSCRITLTARATGYREETRTFDMTVNRLNMRALSWRGYASSRITYGDAVPALAAPTGAPGGASFNYVSNSAGVCLVDSTSGVLIILNQGTCRVSLTARATGYNDQNIHKTVTVNPASINLVWPGYAPGALSFGDSLSLHNPVVIPGDAILAYNSSTQNVCTVDSSTGILTIRDAGTCRVSLTASKFGHRNNVINQNVVINPRLMSTLAWSGYLLSEITFGDNVPPIREPTGVLVGATISYASRDTAVCSVDSSSGALTVRSIGSCVVALTARARGHSDLVIERTVEIAGRGIDLVWRGYHIDKVGFGSSLALRQPTVTPSDAVLRYTSSTPNVCRVGSSDGRITHVDDGVCTVTLTASKIHHSDASATKNITITPLRMSNASWSGYSSDNTTTYPGTPFTLILPTGLPGGSTVGYFELSGGGTAGCHSVHSQLGTFSFRQPGTCIIRARISANGYVDSNLYAIITVNPGEIDLTWTGYSASGIAFGDTLTLTEPVVSPGGVTLNYTSITPAVCTVDSTTGAVTQESIGTCTIGLRATKDHYNNEYISRDLTIQKGLMSDLNWTGYENNNTATFPNTVPDLVSPTGAPSG